MSSRVPLPWLVAVTIFTTYLVTARGPQNLFPLSVFDMYQGHAPEVVARVLVIDADGNAAEIDAYEDWSCAWDADLLNPEPVCGSDHRPLRYVTRDQSRYLEAHAGAVEAEVRLVSRAYRLREADVYADCTLARCRARRRE